MAPITVDRGNPRRIEDSCQPSWLVVVVRGPVFRNSLHVLARRTSQTERRHRPNALRFAIVATPPVAPPTLRVRSGAGRSCRLGGGCREEGPSQCARGTWPSQHMTLITSRPGRTRGRHPGPDQ
jgi:hypothetical protein